MPHLLTGIDWLDDLFLHPPMPRNTRTITVTVNGDDRDVTWKEGVGIYVAGHNFGKGDTVKIEGAAHEVTEMRRMQMHGEAVTLIVTTIELAN